MKPVFIIIIVSVAMIGVMIPNVFAEFTIQGENIPSNSPYNCESQEIMTSNRNHALEISLVAYTLNDDVSLVVQVDDQIIKTQKLSTNDERLPLIFKHELSNYNPDPMAAKKMYSTFLQICLLTSSNNYEEKSLTVLKLSWNYVSTPTDEPVLESTDEITLNPIYAAAKAAEDEAESAIRSAEAKAAEAEARADAAIRAAEAKAAQDLTNLVIIGGIAIIIISVAIVLAKRKNKKSSTPQRSTPSPYSPPPNSPTNTETSTLFFYECPKCHSGDIENNPDGSVNCPSCGYRG